MADISEEKESDNKECISVSSELINESSIPTDFMCCTSSEHEPLEPNGSNTNFAGAEGDATEDPCTVAKDKSEPWTKNDVACDLDVSHGDRIWNRFVFYANMLKNNKKYERDMREDAFYFSYKTVPVNSIEVIRSSKELLRKMECKELRETSLQLVDYSADLNREVETFIRIERNTKEEICNMLGDSILRKKRVLDLVNRIRNYIGDIILMGERCYSCIETSEAIALRNIASINKRFKDDGGDSDS